jgi:hypothetical protein
MEPLPKRLRGRPADVCRIGRLEAGDADQQQHFPM